MAPNAPQNGASVNGNGHLNGVNGKASPKFTLGDFSVDEFLPMKVVVIGAGFSGIIAGIRFPQHIPNVDLTIYEKNEDIGGTWHSNRYPGIACDIPSHCYQLTFEENTDWSAFYAPGSEIKAYLSRVVEKYKLMRYIKLRHELIHALYDESSSKWKLTIRKTVTLPSGEVRFVEFEDWANVVLTGVGALSTWRWPEIPGLDVFEGSLMHSAHWEAEGEDGSWQEGVRDWKDKKVGVIGVGSSALQIVPALQPRVQKLYNFVRGKTWLATPFASDKVSQLIGRDKHNTNYEFTDQDREAFRDKAFYKEFRRDLESELNSVHPATLKGTSMQNDARAAFKVDMIRRLAKKPWIADYLIPDFPVACRRLTPGPGYLEALCEDNTDFVTTHISRITPKGIETVDGKHYDLDVIVCATGYETTFKYPFTVVGRSGQTLSSRFTPHPETYLTVCTDGFPNWFMSLGPNAGVGSGSLLVIIERQIDYAVKVVQKMQRERLRSIEVSAGAVKDFDEYLENYFPTTVYSEKCRSWYKMGNEDGRVAGLWPGSCLHAVRALANPRWEDFVYEKMHGVGNRFHWLGDGSTYNEKHMTGDRAWYLNDEEIDIPTVPK